MGKEKEVLRTGAFFSIRGRASVTKGEVADGCRDRCREENREEDRFVIIAAFIDGRGIVDVVEKSVEVVGEKLKLVMGIKYLASHSPRNLAVVNLD